MPPRSAIRHAALFLLLMLGCCILPALAAASTAPAARYGELKEAVTRLKADARRSQWRAPWEELAAGFERLAEGNPRWKNAPAALFRAAQCREELSRRSLLKADRLKAARQYCAVAEHHPHSVLADDALLAAARLYAGPLKDWNTAAALLDAIESRYPRGDMLGAARRLRQSSPGGVRQTDGAPPRAPARPVQPSSRQALASMGAQLGLHIRTVFIDAGHGGKDPGAVHHGTRESEVTLDMARHLERRLKAAGLKVVCSRSGGSTVSLARRAALANASGADIFVSLHVNASADRRASGLETYYLDLARDHRAMQVAMRENSGSGRGLGEMNTVLARVLLHARNLESRTLAADIQNRTASHMREQGRRLKSNGVRSAPFFVLMSASMPSVLVEVGYLSNPEEAARLRDAAYRRQLAEGIAAGILRYKRRMESSVQAGLSLTGGRADAI